MEPTSLQRTTEEMRCFISREVATGFRSLDDIIETAVEQHADNQHGPAVLGPLAERTARDAWAARLEEQNTWPGRTDCDLLDSAFGELNRAGVVARHNFSCCGTCGVAEIGDEIAEAAEDGLDVRGYTFYHMQDTDSAVEGYGLYLNYGALEAGEAAALRVGNEIVDALQRHGLKTRWNGSWEERIWVGLDWKRRLPHHLD
jgi:hypothetical protein